MWDKIKLNNFFLRYKYDILILTVVGITATVFRVVNLENWPRYYVDEGTYGMVGYNIYRGIWGHEDIYPLHFPYLPSVLVGFLPHIFGREYFIIRLPNAIAGTFSCLLVYLIGRQLYNRQIGAIAAILMAVSFTTVYINRLAMKDNIMQLFWLLSVLFYILLLKDDHFYHDKKRWKYLLGISLGFAFISKYSALAAVLFVVLHSLVTNRIRLVVSPVIIFALIAATIPLIAAILDWSSFIPEMMRQSAAYKKSEFEHGGFYAMLNVLVLGIPTDQLHWGLYYVNIWTTLGFLSLLYLAAKKDENHQLLLMWAASIFVVYVIFIPSYWIYLLPLTPVYYLATANLIFDIKNKKENWFILIILVALLLLPEFYFKHFPSKLIAYSSKFFFAISAIIFLAIAIKQYADKIHLDINKRIDLESIPIFILLFLFASNLFYAYSVINTNEVADQKDVAAFINANTKPNEIVAAAAPLTYLLVNATPVEYEHVLFYTTKEPTILLEPRLLSKFKLDVSLEKVKFFVIDTPWNVLDAGRERKITPTITQDWIKVYHSGDYAVYLNPKFKVKELKKEKRTNIKYIEEDPLFWTVEKKPTDTLILTTFGGNESLGIKFNLKENNAIYYKFTSVQNFSALEFNSLSFDWYGNNSGIISVDFLAPDYQNYFHASFKDTWTGWKLLYFTFNKSFTTVGNPSWDKVKALAFKFNTLPANGFAELDEISLISDKPLETETSKVVISDVNKSNAANIRGIEKSGISSEKEWVSSSIPKEAINGSEVVVSSNAFKLTLASPNIEIPLQVSVASNKSFYVPVVEINRTSPFVEFVEIEINQTIPQFDTSNRRAYDFLIVFSDYPYNLFLIHYLSKPDSYFEVGKIKNSRWYPIYGKWKNPPENYTNWKLKINNQKIIFYENDELITNTKNDFNVSSFKLKFAYTTNDTVLRTWEINNITIKNTTQLMEIYTIPSWQFDESTKTYNNITWEFLKQWYSFDETATMLIFGYGFNYNAQSPEVKELLRIAKLEWAKTQQQKALPGGVRWNELQRLIEKLERGEA